MGLRIRHGLGPTKRSRATVAKASTTAGQRTLAAQPAPQQTCAGPFGHHVLEGVATRCARRSWRYPTGASPVRLRRSEPPGNEYCERRGNAGSEAHTVIAWGMGLSHEMTTVWRPRRSCPPKAKCVVPLSRGAIAAPGSKAISRAKGTCRNLGGPAASAGMVIGGGSQQSITGADRIAAGSRTGP
jgi:hypothetical protein